MKEKKRIRNRNQSKKVRSEEENYLDMRSKKIKVSEEGSYFDRIPLELIIAIFDKILDVKCLCICSSVSKCFAAHVLQTRFVSVEIGPSRECPVPVWQPGLGVKNFLKKLCCVESATMQFSSRNRDLSKIKRIPEPLVWWKSDSYGFILVASSDHEVTPTRKFGVDKRWAVFRSIQDNLFDFMVRFSFTKELLALLPNLKSISVVDSRKQGRIVLGEEGIACVRRENPLEGRGKLCVRQWVARKVKLPLSGRVMENVFVILTREIGASDDLIAENLLEENEYREIAVTMMQKHAYSQSELRYLERATIATVTCDKLVFCSHTTSNYTHF